MASKTGGAGKSAPVKKKASSKPAEASAKKKTSAKPDTKTPVKSSAKVKDLSSPKYFVISAVLCAIALFIVICYAFPESCGFVGEWTKDTLFGLFAGSSMLVPIFLFAQALYLKRDVESGHIFYRPIFSAVVVVILSAMLHAIFAKSNETIGALDIGDAAEFFAQGKGLLGGGLIGGVCGSLIMMCVGITGTIILTVLFILFSSIFLLGFTPGSFVTRIKRLHADLETRRAVKQEKKEAAAAAFREERMRAEAAAMAREEKRRAQAQAASAEAERKRAEAEARAREKQLKAAEEEREIERIRKEAQAHRAKAQEIRRESLAAQEAFRASSTKRRADIGMIFSDELDDPKPVNVKTDESVYDDEDKEFRGESVAEFWNNNQPENTDEYPEYSEETEEVEETEETEETEEGDFGMEDDFDVKTVTEEEIPAYEEEISEETEICPPVYAEEDAEDGTESEENEDEDGFYDDITYGDISEIGKPRDDEEDEVTVTDTNVEGDIMADTDEAELPEDAIPWEEIIGEPIDEPVKEPEEERVDPMADELRRTLDGAKRKMLSGDGNIPASAPTDVKTENAEQYETDEGFEEYADVKTSPEEADIQPLPDEIIPEEPEEPEEEPVPEPPKYVFPPLDLLKRDPGKKADGADEELAMNADKLVATLRSFNVRAKIVDVSRGPTITRYEIGLEAGTRVRTIMNLVDDISYALATNGVRIEGVIPGKSAIGIEVPNQASETVYLRSLLEDKKFTEAKSCLTSALGKSVSGENIYLDIAKMPHLLIAGTTGSGKSVCINTMLISLLYKATPDEVKLVLVDPKKVELNVYNGIPHLLVPVVFDPKKAAGALHWCVTEMERRFDLIESMNVRNLDGYNKAIEDDPTKEKLPRIVIVIDELADLMMTASNEVETSICRIAQKARAAGMHLIIGTQRPSVDVITGLIKANVPSRIAFTVMSQVDSRTIIDSVGAEKLIGRGDMLFAPIGSNKPMRAQGAFVSDAELESIIDFIKENAQKAEYSDEIIARIDKEAALCGKKGKARDDAADALADDDEEEDPKLDSAIKLAVESGKISTSLIQRKLSLGYGRAAKLIDVMERRGIVGKPEGQKPREVLITKEQYLEMQMRSEGTSGMTADDFPEDEV